MKKFKKILAISLVLVMMLGMIPFIGAGATNVQTIYDYVDADDIERYEAVAVLTRIGVLRGDPDGRFRPNDHFTRAEAAAVIARFNLGVAITNMLPPAPTGFSDVSQAHWASRYVAFAVEQGIIVGFPDGSFRPDQNVTATQFAAMLLRSLGYGELGEFEGPAWELNVIVQATANQQMFPGIEYIAGPILTGDADFTAPATREWVAQYALNAMRWVDVIYGTTVAAGLVTQGYMPRTPVRQLMTRVHDLTAPTTHDAFGRPHTEWRQAGLAINVEVPQGYHVRYTATQTATTVGILVRDHAFAPVAENATNLWINGQPQDPINTAAALQELTANGTEVIVYVGGLQRQITRVVVIQTDLFQVDTIDTANRRVHISALSEDPLRQNFVVAHSPIAVDNTHYEYLRELTAGGRQLTGGGDIVLVVPVWNVNQFVVYDVQVPELNTGVLTVKNVAASTLTHDGVVYHLSRAIVNNAFNIATPHATNEVRLWVDAFGFAVDVRTVPAPPSPTHVLILENDVLIQEGTRLFSDGIRGITNLGVEVFWRVTGPTTLGQVFAVSAPVAGVRTLTVPPVHGVAGQAPANNLVTLLAGGSIRTQDLRLNHPGANITAVSGITNVIPANVRFVYFNVDAAGTPTGTWSTRTGRQNVNPIPAIGNSVALVTGANEFVTTIFISGGAGLQEVENLMFIHDNNPIQYWTTPDGENRSVLRAWLGYNPVDGGLTIRAAAPDIPQFSFFLHEEDENGVFNLQVIPDSQQVVNRRVTQVLAAQNMIEVDGVWYDTTNARVIDARRATGPTGTGQAPMNPTVAGIGQAVALNATIQDVFVSFVVPGQDGRIRDIFITNVTRAHTDVMTIANAAQNVVNPLVAGNPAPTDAGALAAINAALAAAGSTLVLGAADVAVTTTGGAILAGGDVVTITVELAGFADVVVARTIPTP